MSNGTSLVTLTAAASGRIAALLQKAPAGVTGLRLSTPREGCSGFSYAIEYAAAPEAGDKVIEAGAGTLYIAGESLGQIHGSTIDWKDDDFESGFVFSNPNATASCGCGASFAIGTD